jgi:hypothetical protein
VTDAVDDEPHIVHVLVAVKARADAEERGGAPHRKRRRQGPLEVYDELR